MPRGSALIVVAGWVLFPLLIAFGIYYPGLSGPFLFDDIPNLSPMGEFPSLDTWHRLLAFLNSGDAGPTGRPISLASFFINDNFWPSNAYSFKYTNLMIHLLNGLLVMWFSFKLFASTRGNRSALIIGSVTALIWLVHPMQASTVFYVVQRMTELSATFTLAGLIAYLYARDIVLNRPLRGYVGMTAALGIFGLLAIFSKENGALLPIYVLVMEYFFLQPLGQGVPRKFCRWALLFLWAPLVILVAYMIYSALTGYGYSIRDFNMVERLMSEARVLVNYMKNIVLPELGGSGLFHDDYVVSRGLLNPVTTLPSIILLIVVFLGAIVLREKKPLIAFALMWFFAGHLLESTFLPLELYFEHRNYLPMLGFIIAAVVGVYSLSGRLGKIIRIGGVIAICLFSAITFSDARIWGNTTAAALNWAAEHPKSIRAQETAREAMLLVGRPDLARKYVLSITGEHPNDAAAIFQRLHFDCLNSSDRRAYFDKALILLRKAKYSPGSLGGVKTLGSSVLDGKCGDIHVGDYLKLLDALESNPQYHSDLAKHFISYFRGMSYAQLGRLDDSIRSLDRAYHFKPVLDIPLQEALFLVDAGLYDEALALLERFEASDKPRSVEAALRIRGDDLSNLKKAIINEKSAKPVTNKYEK